VLRFNFPVYFATLAVFKQQLFASSVSLSELKARQVFANKEKDAFGFVESANGKAVTETDCDESGKVIDVGSGKEDMKLKNESDGLPVEEHSGECALMPDGKDSNNTKHGKTCDIQNIVVECNAIPFVDTAGCMMLAQLHAEYGKHGIRFILAGCSDDVVSSLKRVEQCQSLCNDAIYPSVQSAVLCLHCDLL